MKRILPALVLAALVLPLVALAQLGTPTECTLLRDLSDLDPACTDATRVNIEDHGICCVYNSIYRVVDWISFALIAVAILLFLIGAFTIITAAGAPERVTSGRNYIIYAIIGLSVAFLVRAVPSIAGALIGV